MYKTREIKSWDDYINEAKSKCSDREVKDLMEWREDGVCLHRLCRELSDGYVDIPQCGARECYACGIELTLSFNACREDCEICIYEGE